MTKCSQTHSKLKSILLIGILIVANGAFAAESSNADVETISEGNVTVYGTTRFGDLDDDAPLILLFHQGGSNGQGEYGAIAPWLNEHGFRAVTWDARSGGSLYGSTNRTRDALMDGTPDHYCDAYSDLQAALNHVVRKGYAKKVIVWGSSYSGALVFRLAADNPESVAGVMAFSPASGDPMVGCRARLWADDVTQPMVVFKPTSEMERESSIQQGTILTNAGGDFFVVKDGIHGSSMLVDERTEHDMSVTRKLVIEKLNEIVASSGI